MKITCIILNFNGYKQSEECLRSLGNLNVKVAKIAKFIVDNASTDDSLEKFYRNKAKLKIDEIIENEKNLGFAKAANIGIRKALNSSSDYICILNNDVVFYENFFPDLLASGLDISAPVIHFKHSDKDVYDYGGKIDFWTGRTTHIEYDSLQNTKNGMKNEIDYVSGTCMVIKRKVFERIGLFDEDYFFYFEDADFCLKAKRNGLSVGVVPQKSVFHKLSYTIGRWSGKAIYYNITGNIIFISKNLGMRKIFGYIYITGLVTKILLNKFIFHR